MSASSAPSASRAVAWWVPSPGRFPPPNQPLLAPYDPSKPGYEFLLESSIRPGAEMDAFARTSDGRIRICLWDLREQKKDPAAKDPEKKRINDMQRALGNLSDEDRCLRLQIACHQRCYYTFPDNVDLIIGGIARGQADLSQQISCEPPWRWMREVLLDRQHKSDHPDLGRQEQILLYADILSSWALGATLPSLQRRIPTRAALAEQIYTTLGLPDDAKRWYVRKLAAVLQFWGCMSGLPWDVRSRDLAAVLAPIDRTLDTLGRAAALDKLIAGLHDHGACHHAFFRHVDHIIADLGASKHVDLPGGGQERARVLTAEANYVHALGSWLIGRTLADAATAWPAGKIVTPGIYDALGAPAPRKRFLAAALWKTLQDNQAARGRGALDEQPDTFKIPAKSLA